MKRLLFGLYRGLILFSLPATFFFLAYRFLMRPSYRDGMMQRLGFYPSDFFRRLSGKKVIWVHAVSVGEVISSEIFLHSLKEHYPEAAIVFSTTTPTGQAAARQRLKGVDRFIYFPLDFPWAIRKLIDRISPTLFIFLETELWPFFLQTLSNRKIPSILVNGRISDRGFLRYRRVRFFMSKVLEEVSLFLMQTERDAEKIKAIGAPIERVFVTGNMKYDQAALRRGEEESPVSRAEIGLQETERLLIAGSTHEGEEVAVLSAYRMVREVVGPVRLLIAPRHLERLEGIEELLLEKGFPTVRKTRVGSIHKLTLSRSQISPPIILLDTLGELDRFYPLADLVFVGGSLIPVGGHNVLEPAAQGKPVFFGPQMSNFREIADQLKGSGGGIEIANGEEMGEKMCWLIAHPDEMKKRGENAYQVVLMNRGAVLRNMEQVARWLPN
ncbi:MAG: 3-deoxy-D-manno-octulosonic acid transferase [Candidatus Manganitrophaceae bacterium]